MNIHSILIKRSSDFWKSTYFMNSLLLYTKYEVDIARSFTEYYKKGNLNNWI